MMTRVRTTYLEMLSPEALRFAAGVPDDLLVLRASLPSPDLNRSFYTGVGGDWFWIDRLSWSWDQWMAWLDREEVETWLAVLAGTPAGYVELERQPDESVQVAYFGVLRQFTGRGIGGYLLSHAVHRAWRMATGIRRVWVHTCTLDHPGALRSYLARGFTICKEEEADMPLPAVSPGPWPGAERTR